MHGLDALFGRFSLVGDQPFHPNDQFAWTAPLEAEWTTIRAELDRILEHRDVLPNFQDITKDVTTITRDDRWKTFFLYGYGEKVEQNCARCPETARLVEAIPGMRTAFFSILAPGKHIPAHRGPYKGLLRYHLGLKVPAPNEQCRIRVSDEVRHWEEGKGMVFDDTYNHEVWNDTDGERAILFLDVERPLPGALATFNRFVLDLLRASSTIQDAQKNQEKWSERLSQAERERSAHHPADG